MSSARAFAVTSRLALLTALLMFGLIVIGSVVRTTGSGLACPDWPLCQGRLIPPLQFNVLIEWSHRCVALLVSVLLFATCGWALARREVRARLGGLAALAVVLLLAQVLLGALTVWKLLSPLVVSGHLAVALLLFSTLLALALAAQSRIVEAAPAGLSDRPPGLLALFATATVMTYGQALLGGLVSTQNAGLACPDWPTCNGQWLPPLEGAVGLQMMHRFGAYALAAVMVLLAIRARRAPDPVIRAGAPVVLGLVFAQMILGVSNVLLGLPVWISAMHLADAAAILGLMVMLTFRVASMPARASRAVPA
ncbi:MAG TPA: COX15/CtaA family protein [Candidatus Sulfotelmatobacter sp.]|nr:COX15/CtaA family protein [Candidatus Sulfotelmatobacter sp.]